MYRQNTLYFILQYVVLTCTSNKSSIIKFYTGTIDSIVDYTVNNRNNYKFNKIHNHICQSVVHVVVT